MSRQFFAGGRRKPPSDRRKTKRENRNKRTRHGIRGNRRSSPASDLQQPEIPPEDWYEPTGIRSDNYRVITQPPGKGYVHAVTEAEVRQCLSELPRWMIQDLDVVQLSRLTRKKLTVPLYGMQWGTALYLYPVDESLTETYYSPPDPALEIETRMYGGRWVHEAPDTWTLVWNERSIRDYFLNNILVHELGHLLDERNSGYVDRERYAEWFAIEHGYLRTQHQRQTRKRPIKRRHHAP